MRDTRDFAAPSPSDQHIDPALHDLRLRNIMSDNHDLVCVFNATNPTKAELIRNLLEAEGVKAVTADTHNPFPGLSIMPSEVYVARESEATALAIIAAAEQARESDTDDDV